MSSGAVARRYARALFELASEAGSVESVAAGLSGLAEAVDGLDAGALAPGLLSAGQRDQLAKALGTHVGLDTLLGRFVAVLAGNDRLGELPGVHDWFQRMEDEAAGRVRIRVRSASPLPEEARAALRSRFAVITGRKVLETVELDDALLGGLTVEAEGRVYDGSIRTQLARLERRMAG